MEAGMREAVTCGVCSEIYEAGHREPLVLPCGHTFCRSCLAAIRRSGNFLCPSCRKPHNHVQVEALTVNYSLLSVLPLCSEFEIERCTKHGDDLRYWCCSCNLPLCSLCLYSGHPQGHTVKLAQTFVQEKQLALEGRIKQLVKNIEDQKDELSDNFRDFDQVVRQLFQRSSNLHQANTSLDDLLDEIKKVSSIGLMMHYEKRVEEFQSTEKNSASENSDEPPAGDQKQEQKEPAAEAAKMTDEQKQQQEEQEEQENVFPPSLQRTRSGGYHVNVLGRQAIRVAGRRKATLLQHRHTLYALRQQQQQQQQQQQLGQDSMSEVRRAVLDYSDGRLLLHSLAEPVSTRHSLEVPSEVFLELGVGDKCLGRVYISLWCNLRRAQQLLVLCTGMLGPSLVDAKASEQFRQLIVFRQAIGANKAPVTQCLLTGLEWGGSYAKRETEGHLVAIDGNSTIAFGICTATNPNTTNNCPFGKVEAGLEVVKAALQHNPITDVTITHCGLVLPGLSQ